jgi:hypothetical protein
MRTFVFVLLGGFLGLIGGYWGGVTMGCDWLMPTSNLCGIYGALVTGPAGLIIGMIVGWRISRRKARRS